MTEVSIHLRPLPGSPWIRDDIGCGTSALSFKGEADKQPCPLTLVSVHLNGRPLRHQLLDAFTVAVSPRVPRQGDRLEVRCIRPDSTQEAPALVTPAHPTPTVTYGLTAPANPRPRNTP